MIETVEQQPREQTGGGGGEKGEGGEERRGRAWREQGGRGHVREREKRNEKR